MSQKNAQKNAQKKDQKKDEKKDEKKIIVRNRRALHNYAIEHTFEAGIVLVGPEVKSLREGQVSIAEAYALFRNGELFLMQMHIPEYDHKGYAPHDPLRTRKLLLHKRELAKMEVAVTRQGRTVVPLQLYFFRGRVKVELGIGLGRKVHDKRQKMKDQAARREIREASREGR